MAWVDGHENPEIAERIEWLESALAAEKAERSAAELRNARLAVQVSRYETDFAGMKANYEERIAAEKARTAELEENLGALRSDTKDAVHMSYLRDAHNRLSAATAEIARLSNERDEALKEAASWKASYDSRSFGYHSAHDRLTEASAEIARLRGLLEDAETYVATNPRTGAPHVAERIRSALSASAPTKEPGGGG